ncbi:RNA polymerase sigma-70 factor [Maribellus luteus]|uniref:RNA polymerase sigma-70 factor n=1 Tax=Maribellus luteus TaxID=2305463 RepID=A0A399T2J5_9BACT|nr:RNA polymerase sigma-70 factor [Maribellus luteus]RIJ50546.1 RNA polymerase sigma-70 factor [Maribellus luteus]
MDKDSHNIFNKVKGGDKVAFHEIFEQNFSFLCYYAENILKNKHDAEDIVEEFFIKIWEKREHIHINSNLKSYMLRSVHNQCIDHLRKKSSNIICQIEEFADLSMLRLSTSCYTANGAIELQELNSKIHQAIYQLPEACRKTFQMSRFEDLTYREISLRMNVSVNTVEMQMGRALKKLRISLNEYLKFLFFLVAALYIFHVFHIL